MVKGKIETQTDAIKSGVIVGSVIGGIILLAAVIVTVIVIVVLKRGKLADNHNRQFTLVLFAIGRTAEEDITKEFVMVEVTTIQCRCSVNPPILY